jgi:predicted acetyltransferase
MRIEKHLASELIASQKEELKKRVEREFGNVAIVREHVWSEPTWVFMGFADEQLVSFLHIVDRQVLADGASVHYFGLANVITEPEHRGKNYASQLNRMAIEFMRDCDPNACGFLLCADGLIPFYTNLGWKRFEGKVTVSQPSGDKLWPSNAMIYDLVDSRSPKTIHLQGLPW